MSKKENEQIQPVIYEDDKCKCVVESWLRGMNLKLKDFSRLLTLLEIEVPVKVILATDGKTENNYLICLNLEDITKVTEMEISPETIIVNLPNSVRNYKIPTDCKLENVV